MKAIVRDRQRCISVPRLYSEGFRVEKCGSRTNLFGIFGQMCRDRKYIVEFASIDAKKNLDIILVMDTRDDAIEIVSEVRNEYISGHIIIVSKGDYDEGDSETTI